MFGHDNSRKGNCGTFTFECKNYSPWMDDVVVDGEHLLMLLNDSRYKYDWFEVKINGRTVVFIGRGGGEYLRFGSGDWQGRKRAAGRQDSLAALVHLVRSRGAAAFEQPIAAQSFGHFL